MNHWVRDAQHVARRIFEEKKNEQSVQLESSMEHRVGVGDRTYERVLSSLLLEKALKCIPLQT